MAAISIGPGNWIRKRGAHSKPPVSNCKSNFMTPENKSTLYHQRQGYPSNKTPDKEKSSILSVNP